ncbi:cytochrome P450 9D4 [Tribolium castaneum]|uniref:Cytochrome P450 9D4 n=2 Tax=Tribolium castaneum TaxID=7070 RepID=D6WUU5_TRICA|nr:PREDICTED: cytochrome P450 9e2-like [Tribolium castaneum]EFA09142.1 cytochrome P450 9D4 [Tribolium castaneum]|eukprot:XP_015838490.1 PREDICTED: cytochrome P450 9e2-like [Tribolium castaneum]
MLTIILSVILGALIYYKLIKPASFWEERNITHASAWPLVGSMWESVIQKKNVNEVSTDIYNKYPNDRYVGYMQFTDPVLLIRDLDLIKQIGVKVFDNFRDHHAIAGFNAEPLFTKSLIFLEGEEWKQMRATLSPAFTSSKMKNMYHLIYECAENFAKHFQDKKQDVEVKDIFSRFTNDIIATVAFGIQINSLEERNNAFYLNGKSVTSFNGKQLLKFFVAQLAPQIFEFFKLCVFDQNSVKYFYNIIIDNMHKREKEGIVRPDLIHLLMEARKGKLKHDNSNNEGGDGFATVEESDIGKNFKKMELTDELMVAQALLFFFAGFETVSTGASFLAHELATNPDVQRKLQEEIDSVLEENQEKISYITIQSMKYLDQVISESLRLWPPAPQTDRLCNTDFVLEPTKPHERRFTIEKGVTIIIPFYGIHRDPEYFPNPDKFDPERFSDENKAKIVPGTYMPFGVGPRNCIGSRLALLELKTLFFHLLSKCDIVTNSKTVIPLKISPNNGNITPKEGIHLTFKPRNVA